MRAKELTQLPQGVTVYVDMDGVLADLFNHVGELHDVEHYNKMTQQQWEEFFKNSNAYELFKNLPAFPTANKLLSIVKNFAGGYKILSSPLNFDKEGSIKGKKEWLAKHINVPADAWVFEHEKQKYATSNGLPNILIDDYGVNIRNWQAAGGIAIKYQADEDSLKKVFDGLRDAKEILSNKDNVDEGKKKRKRKSRWAAYGPGPYGWYGYDSGYSGSGGLGDGGAVGEEVDEGWKDWVAGAGLAAMAAGGGGAAYDAYKASQSEKEPTAVVAKSDNKSNFTKGVERISKDAIPKHLVSGSPHEKFLTKAAVAAGIKGEELAQFLAQTAHESHNFKSMVEYGGSLDFKKYEPKFVKDKKSKKVTQVNPKAKTLGNVKVGDGARYKGRGYIQLTGRYNYKKAGTALGLPLEDKPELVEKPEVAAKVAIWFWQNRVQPKVDDFGNTPAATKPINSGLKGLEDRKEKFQDYKTAMK
jgi:predicted chitinase/5'(3')-deoxyribonucleotidase